jgi:hypothetical protein
MSVQELVKCSCTCAIDARPVHFQAGVSLGGTVETSLTTSVLQIGL